MSSKTAPQIAPGKGPQSNHGIARGREPQFSRGSADYSLQQTLGNQATCQLFKSGMIQAKLRVSQPGDPDELEADRVADQVVSAGRSGVTSQRPFLPILPSSAPPLHRKCA